MPLPALLNIIFPRAYNVDVNAPMGAALISHPSVGKHLAFDGRLLPGAPAHPALRRRAAVRDADEGDGKGEVEEEGDPAPPLRVTFLVNVWPPNGRPAGVSVLSAEACRSIAALSTGGGVSFLSGGAGGGAAADLILEERTMESLEVGCGAEGDRIRLPFVSGGATWIDDDVDGGLVLSMVPPPPPDGGNYHHRSDGTFLVRYCTEAGPRLDLLDEDDWGGTDVDEEETSEDGYV